MLQPGHDRTFANLSLKTLHRHDALCTTYVRRYTLRATQQPQDQDLRKGNVQNNSTRPTGSVISARPYGRAVRGCLEHLNRSTHYDPTSYSVPDEVNGTLA